MHRSIRRSFACLAFAAALALLPRLAAAVPILQLDIAGGHYQDGTIVTSSDSFTVYAYATPKGNETSASLLGKSYFLSVALTPETGPTNAALGSFTVNGTTYSATADMTYGVPPIETDGTAAHDGGDLGGHGVFETFFVEIPFSLNAANTSGEYNTEDLAGQGPIPGTDMFSVAFSVDKSGLASGTELHFDVYTKAPGPGRRSVDLDKDLFAPFSHDAGTIAGRPVPEPTAALIFAIGLFAARRAGRR